MSSQQIWDYIIVVNCFWLYSLYFRELIYTFKLFALIPVCMIWSLFWHHIYPFFLKGKLCFIFLEIYDKNYLIFWKIFYWEQCIFEIQVTNMSFVADIWMVILYIGANIGYLIKSSGMYSHIQAFRCKDTYYSHIFKILEVQFQTTAIKLIL